MVNIQKLFPWLVICLLLIHPAYVLPGEKISLVQSNAKPGQIADELLVKFKPGVAKVQQSQTISTYGAKEIRRIGKQQRYSRIKLKKGQSLQQALAAYRAEPNVEHVQPNYIYYSQAVPDDAEYSQLWGLSNLNGNDIDAELAWDRITNCSKVIVAVLDTGIDYTHQDLATNMWDGSSAGYPNHGYDFVGESVYNSILDDDPLPMGAVEYHGTHIAGTIAAVGNNSYGITGVCWRAQIMSVRVVDGSGTGSTLSIIQGIEFAVDNGAKVINMSLGFQGAFDQAFSDVITYAEDHDVVVVVAAGNDGMNNDTASFYPCNFTHTNLICVTALDQDYLLASFSNYGLTSVDVGAPGVDIFSAVPAGQTITDSLDLEIIDPINGWTTNNGHWTTAPCDFVVDGVPTTLSTLINPASWCDQTGTYVANADDKIYKMFDLGGGANHAMLFYQAFIETQTDTDYFSSAFDAAGGDPFDGANDKPLLNYSGINDTDNYYFIHDLTECRSSTCSIGFRLTSNSRVQLAGIGIPVVIISTLESGANNYETLQGTSVAAPHVAGIAAMVRAYNPDYTSADTIAAIEQGGEYLGILDGITSTSNAANAMGGLSYINRPTGVIAVVE